MASAAAKMKYSKEEVQSTKMVSASAKKKGEASPENTDGKAGQGHKEKRAGQYRTDRW